MKIRIKGNSLRLRLTQSEVSLFLEDGQVSDRINFGENQLIYMLQSSNCIAIEVSYKPNFITVCMPKEKAVNWASNEEVSVSQEIELKNSETLTILIEKDFQCLKPRFGEDESDLYQNPEA